MRIAAREGHLVVISDIHLGHPCYRHGNRLTDFLRRYHDRGYSICISGDGLDILQTLFLRIARDVPPLLNLLRSYADSGRNVYDVIGNHDLVLEHFMDDFRFMMIVPFLNLRSGDARIRIEHGYIYDPLFVGKAERYELLTYVAGLVVKAFPPLYGVWMAMERRRNNRLQRRARAPGIDGEHPALRRAAERILERGFDAVVFGHTHFPGRVELERGSYLNTGSWLSHMYSVVIDQGALSLESI